MRFLKVFAVFLVAAGLSASLLAQITSTGNIYGRVTDESGGVLPGVMVTLTGVGAPLTTTTSPQGDFRFINLSPGTYALKAELAGFATVERPNVVVNIGSNTNLTVPMKLAAVTATITVTSESPLLDPRRQRDGAVFNQRQLESIPTGRDPWVIIQQTPGVQIDRLNIGGTQSGQQSAYVGKGTDAGQNTFNVDGVTITDMAALGSSPTYFDFDAFQEMQVGTGGTDASIATPGVQLNMVTKRGTNTVHGSARYFVTPWQLQGNNLPQEAKDEGYTNQTVDRVCEACSGGTGIQDYGVELGGPLWRDKAWLWGAYGEKVIPLTKLGPPTSTGFGPSDTTYLDNYAAKANVQPIESLSLTGFFLRGDKKKYGRSAGRTRPAETSVDQKGPTTIWKGEASGVIGTHFILGGSYSYIRGGFGLIPEGGTGVDVYEDASQVYHRSFQVYSTRRPQHQVTANASYFFNTGSIGHELKFGYGYRDTPVTSLSAWPGTGNVGRVGGGSVCPVDCADVTRPGIFSYGYTYNSAYLTDALTATNNLTVNLGLRYDYQYGINNPSNVPGNPVFPDLLPGLAYPGNDKEFTFKDWQPRVGVTYALGAQKTTLLRASYARYADQLGGSTATWDNPNGAIQGLRFNWTDLDHDNNVDPGELGSLRRTLGGFDPACPGCASSANIIDPDLKNTKTDELSFGVEQQIVPEFVVGLNYTYRHRDEYIWSPYKGVTSASYDTVLRGDPADLGSGLVGVDKFGNIIGPVTVYTGTLPDDFDGGQFVTNRPDYTTTFHGVSLELNKRLANRWMAHASVGWGSNKENVGSKGCVDPTNQAIATGYYFVGQVVGPTCQDGAQLYQESLGSGNFTNVWIGSRWNFNATGLYQLPWNFNIAANLYGRQGYVNPFYVLVDTDNGEGARYVQIGTATDHRLKNVYNLDMRLDKVINISQKVDVTLSFEVFNVISSNTILQRETDATPDLTGFDAATQTCDYGDGPTRCVSIAGSIDEIQNPRALRLGARISF